MLDSLTMRGVGFSYGNKPELHDVSLCVPAGRIIIAMGVNGSGKTTLLRIAAGLVEPQQGSALASDGTPTPIAMRQGRIGYIPQQLGLVRSTSVISNVELGNLKRAGPFSILGVRRGDARDRAERALDVVGLREKAHQPVKKLSGGERQRVAIARTLVQQPEIIVADELIASLDAIQQHAIMQLARELTRGGTAMLLALHQIDVALASADEVAFLAHGRLSAARSPRDMTPEEARSALAS